MRPLKNKLTGSLIALISFTGTLIFAYLALSAWYGWPTFAMACLVLALLALTTGLQKLTEIFTTDDTIHTNK